MNIINNELNNQYNLPVLEQNRNNILNLLNYTLFLKLLNITSDELEFNLYQNKDFAGDKKIKDLNNIINQEDPLYKSIKNSNQKKYFNKFNKIQKIKTHNLIEDSL